jgi:hypothetical protein
VLKDVNLYEFTMRFYRKRDLRALKADLRFLQKHPLFESHRLCQRYVDVVPVIYGYRLPYVQDRSAFELKCKRALLSLILFKPFREISDLIGTDLCSDKAWLKAFTEWEKDRSEFVKTIMDNMDDYYCGASHAQEQSEVAESKDRDFEAEDANDNDDLFGDDARQGDGDVETWESAPEESDNEDDGVDFAEQLPESINLSNIGAPPAPNRAYNARV